LRNPGAAGGGNEPPPPAEREATREEKLAREEATVKSRVQEWLSTDAARSRVNGSRDAYWQGVQDALGTDFRVDWDVLDKGPSARGGVGRMVREAADAWERAATVYGKNGNPLAGKAGAPGTRRPLQEEFTTLPPQERGFRGNTSLDTPIVQPQAGFGDGIDDEGPFHHRLVTQVVIVQTEGGSIESITLDNGSGNHVYDEIVLARARTLAKLQLGKPPPGRGHSVWAFATDFTQVPPMPAAGCAIDEYFIPRECFYPMKKSVKSGVHLEAVY
jgi:hypothetical protein